MLARAPQPATSLAERIATRSLARFYAWIVAGLVILYIITFPIFRSAILVTVPAAVAGWFYYRRGGALASVLAVLLNLFLIDRFIGPLSLSTLFNLQSGFLTGHIFVAVISITFGYLRGV